MALKPCKECKKEVSTAAQTCPNCGVKSPTTTTAQALGGCLVILVIAGALVVACSDSDTEKTSTANALPEFCEPSDAQCLFTKNKLKAGQACRPAIQSLAKYDYKWTDGMLKPTFSHFRYSQANNTMVYIGDQIKMVNGLGNEVRHTYECEYDLKSSEIVSYKATPGRIQS